MGNPESSLDPVSRIKSPPYRLLLITFTFFLWIMFQYFSGFFMSRLLHQPTRCCTTLDQASEFPEIEIVTSFPAMAKILLQKMHSDGIPGAYEAAKRLGVAKMGNNHLLEITLKVKAGKMIWIGPSYLIRIALNPMDFSYIKPGEKYYGVAWGYYLPKAGPFGAAFKRAETMLFECGFSMKTERDKYFIQKKIFYANLLVDRDVERSRRYLDEIAKESQENLISPHIRLSPVNQLDLETYDSTIIMLLALIIVPSLLAFAHEMINFHVRARSLTCLVFRWLNRKRNANLVVPFSLSSGRQRGRTHL